MKRWHWTSLALLGGILAVALIAVPRFSGGTQHAVAQEPPSLVLDMDITDGCTAPATECPCATLTDHQTRNVGDTYKIAVCLVNAVAGDPPVAAPPEDFGFNLLYNKTLNQCVPGAAGADAKPGFDFNPDANEGATTFTTGGLGDPTDWDCTSGGSVKPTCDSTTGDQTVGTAHLACGAIKPGPTLPAGNGIAAPVAEITFHALANGDDTLVLQDGVAANFDGDQYLQCPVLGACVGGIDHKIGGSAPEATNTATPTRTLGPTPTPACGFEGLPTCTPTPKAHTPTPTITATPTATAGAAAPPAPPPAAPPSGGAGGNVVRPPNTGDGSSSTPWGASLEWMIAGTAAISLAGGAFYLRRVRMRR